MSYQWKCFVPETNELQSNEKQRNNNIELDGNDVKQFYDDVISTTKTCQISDLKIVKSKSQNTKYSESLHSIYNGNKTSIPSVVAKFDKEKLCNTILKASQENDVETIKNCLQANCDINVQDSYGWTPLMCAAKSNSLYALSYLLSQGADLTIKDKRGNSVWLIAEDNANVLKLLREHERKKKLVVVASQEMVKNASKNELSEFYCDICKTYYHETSVEKHKSSVVHLLHKNKSTSSFTYYEIPEYNVGFQLLLRNGWNRDNGLGQYGQGTKYPVKTVLKTDRKGLGNKITNKARITHFSSFNTQAIVDKRTSINDHKKEAKRRHRRKLYNEKQKEIEFRRSFYN